ncbi:serine/threonine-protein kinase [Cryobacterium gelidum]|uniref:non-specific serine/threonine protein kinase n=1 Tax=Cryobacterium gelidum TaxID=1259164 RepID=A0A4R9ANN0_9MICO|nr:serine/threonine-protein kinase [Cryobacterium gelidum]TFD66599.1 serine/threonine protein kinase [Cryobacterium gelidum]
MGRRLPSSPPVLSGYTYVRPLGTGGFADVFLFEQNMPRRSVAVKVLLQDIVDDNVLRSFNAEADVMARLSSHPSILTVYDASISADGRPYLVMEYCPGSYSSRGRAEPLPVATVLNVAVRIAGALETAHRSQVLHRDIKPSNILTTTFGGPVLGDFGIAASLAGNAQGELFAMSLPWSAPEVVDERTTGTVATEVWSFGATLYSLLADRAPFELPAGSNGSRALQQRIGRAKYTSIGRADVPASLESALARMMSRDPAARQVSLLECAYDLQRVERDLGLPLTALEVADEAWASAGSPIDFDNLESRGTVISDVSIPTLRPGPQRSIRRPASHTREGTLPDGGDAGRRQFSPLVLTLLLAGAVVIGGGATVGALLIAGLI